MSGKGHTRARAGVVTSAYPTAQLQDEPAEEKSDKVFFFFSGLIRGDAGPDTTPLDSCLPACRPATADDCAPPPHDGSRHCMSTNWGMDVQTLLAPGGSRLPRNRLGSPPAGSPSLMPPASAVVTRGDHVCLLPSGGLANHHGLGIARRRFDKTCSRPDSLRVAEARPVYLNIDSPYPAEVGCPGSPLVAGLCDSGDL